MTVVLVIEDESDIREDVVEILREEGYDARSAANGADALTALRSGPRPALILLDLMMPIMNGLEFRAEQLKEPALATIPVVLMSGMNNLREKAQDLKVTAYLVKPFRLEHLLRVVADCAASARSDSPR